MKIYFLNVILPVCCCLILGNVFSQSTKEIKLKRDSSVVRRGTSGINNIQVFLKIDTAQRLSEQGLRLSIIIKNHYQPTKIKKVDLVG